MVSSSERYRPSATLMGSTSPMRSATAVSGVASFSENRRSGRIQVTGNRSPSSATRARQAAQIGRSGESLISQPVTTGVSSSSSSTSRRISRVLAWPRSPRKTRSWLASRALSTAGITLSSYPTIPAKRVSPAASLAIRFWRISSFTGRSTQPDNRSSPRVPGRNIAPTLTGFPGHSATRCFCTMCTNSRLPSFLHNVQERPTAEWVRHLVEIGRQLGMSIVLEHAPELAGGCPSSRQLGEFAFSEPAHLEGLEARTFGPTQALAQEEEQIGVMGRRRVIVTELVVHGRQLGHPDG